MKVKKKNLQNLSAALKTNLIRRKAERKSEDGNNSTIVMTASQQFNDTNLDLVDGIAKENHTKKLIT